MSYGESLEQSEITAQMKADVNRKNSDGQMTVSMAMLSGQVYAFSRSVVDHNLEDDAGNKLDLNTVGGVSELDAKVGNEIEDLINKLNSPEDLGPFESKPGKPSDMEQTLTTG